MKVFFEKLKSGSAVSSVAFVILGLMLLIKPGLSFNILCKAVGIILLIFAAVNIITNIKNPLPYTSGFFLLGDIAVGAVGIYFISVPEIVKGIIPIILGIIMIFHSVTDIRAALLFKEMGERYKWIMTVGVITLLLAILILFNPFSSGDLIIRLVGAAFLYSGISGLWVIIALYRTEDKHKKAKTVNYKEL